MTITDPDAEAPAPVVLIRFANRCRALVLVTDWPNTATSLRYRAACTGCMDEAPPRSTVHSPREWAAKHARECRALPPLNEQSGRPEQQ